ncbi:RICIN domain-containing protein [Streptomyces sp. BE20]|uniref:RICIN domain-containing protein n=1 Tax=Streptomyces sp. BE20 TaxID=3002525 RepID=UPI002E7966FC|nr:RICIN domain-containing protein [Streptomyces sp. BE20]MEE1825122.1 RICIN domain-containing protein [Streptomyces sp. BE20]
MQGFIHRSARFVGASVAVAALAVSVLAGSGGVAAAGSAPVGPAAAGAAGVVVPVADLALADPGQGSKLRNTNSGMCLVVQGYANNTQAFQYGCLGFDDQFWIFDPVYNKANAFRIRNFHSGKCLVARGTANNGPVVQTDCADFDDQLWWAVSLQAGGYWLKNYNSKLCVIVRGGDSGSGAVVGGCDNRWADQIWTW